MTPPTFLYFPTCNPDPSTPTGCDVSWHDKGEGGRCRKPGKVPAGRWKELDAWSRQRPEGNAAVRTGPDTGLLVIDVDSDAAQAVYDSWGLPPTFTVRSGRPEGGHHYYFRWPDGLINVPPALDGVEVKGPGRYVVAWDSVHNSGRRYEKLGGTLAALPLPFVERLRSAAPQREAIERGLEEATPEAEQRLADWVRLFPDAEERDDGNWWMCCPVHNSVSKSSLSAVASGERVLLKCWAGCPTEAIVEAMGWSLFDLHARPEPILDPEKLVDLSQREPRPRVEPEPGTRMRLPDLMLAPLPEIRWAVPGLVPDGLTLLAGPPKLGKSWLVLDLAIQVAGGGRFLDTAVEAGDVLYLALEDNWRRLQGRARTLLAGSPPPGRLELWTRAGKLGAGLLPEVEDWLDSNASPRLVIIDTLGRVQDGGTLDSKDGGYADAVEALAGLQDMAAARGVAVVVITHTKKGGWTANGDPLEAVLGSQGYAGTADSILVLKRERGEPLGELFVTGREIEDETKLKLRFDDAQCRWIIGHELTLEQEIMRVLAEKPFQLSGSGVAHAVGRRKAEVLAALTALETAGRAQQAAPAGGGWLKWGLPVTNGGAK